MTLDPVFIVGTERSGSNLLRVMLNASSELAVPHPPHVMRYFAPLEHRYGDLHVDANRRRLVRDVVRLVRAHIYPWTVSIDLEALVRDAWPRDLFGVYLALYGQYATAVGKRRWCCKSTFMIDELQRIVAHVPSARMIWLVRDPRAVALSSKDSVFNPCHPYHTARLWVRQQTEGLRFEAETGGDRMLRVHYEQLVTEPDATLARICRFIGIRCEPAMLRFFETDEAHRVAGLSSEWANTASPVQRAKATRFRDVMSSRDVAIVESAAGETMRRLGYRPSMTKLNGDRLHPVLYAAEGALLRLLVECRSIRRDRNAWRRWRRAATLLSIRLGSPLSGLQPPVIRQDC